MSKSEKREVSISTSKTILIVVSVIIIAAITQTLSMLIADLVPTLIGNIITGITYPILVLFCVSLLVTKIFKLRLEDFKIKKPGIKPVWCVVALAMPILVSAALLLTKGHWENTSMSLLEVWTVLTSAVLYYGLTAGLVEELIFRGVIMSALEYRWNKGIAILVPSVIFGAIHAIGKGFDILSIIQLLIAGSIVGILFSLVTYESGSIWCSALIHGIWNTIMIGGILKIGVKADESSIFNYVMDSKSFLITGGDFGVEASIFSVIAYLIAIVLALYLLKRKAH